MFYYVCANVYVRTDTVYRYYELPFNSFLNYCAVYSRLMQPVSDSFSGTCYCHFAIHSFC